MDNILPYVTSSRSGTGISIKPQTIPQVGAIVWYVNKLNKNKACFKRRTLHASNSLKSKENEINFLIIFCFKCVRFM